MRRLARILVADWRLKLAAIVVASLLYGGLVLTQSAQVWRGRVAILPLRQPTSAVLLGSIPDVTSIRYYAPPDVAARISTTSFTATVDLAEVVVPPGGAPITLKVDVVATDPRVQVLDFEPQAIRIRLDPVVSKQLPVEVDRGAVPPGLELRTPEVEPATVTLTGPESIVRLAVAARARVLIQPSGIDVDEAVDLAAVDASGNVLAPVDLEPASVRVRIRVGSSLGTRSLPIRPTLSGAPPAGYEVVSIAVSPSVVLVEGEADTLAGLARIDTAPIDLGDATSGLTATVGLVLPDGVDALGSGTVRVTVALRPTTGTRSFSVAVVPRGARADRSYTLSVPDVIVVLAGPVALLGRLDPASLIAVVDVAGLPDGASTVEVRVTAPTGSGLVSIVPSAVTVTVVPPASSTSSGAP